MNKCAFAIVKKRLSKNSRKSWNGYYTLASRGSEFNLREMFTSIRFEGKTETGKLVAKPNYINSTWIHWPSAVPKRMIGFEWARFQYNVQRLDTMFPPAQTIFCIWSTFHSYKEFIMSIFIICLQIKKTHPDAIQLDIDNEKINEIIDDYRRLANFGKK